jgi:predicted phage-related endonuclease
MATSKRDGKKLQARKDYEHEIVFERTFKVPFTRFVTGAMLRGQEMEDFVVTEYEKLTGNNVRRVGCYYNAYFVASPDGEVGDDGLIEVKWVYDKTFSELVGGGEIPDEHYLQMQGQMWATGRKWCDYVVGNENSGHFFLERVERDDEMIDTIKDSLHDQVLSAISVPGRLHKFSQPPESLAESKEF